MKKIVIGLLLMAFAIFVIFSYKKYTIKSEKLMFSNAINKEYIYLDNRAKTDINITFSNDGAYGSAGVNRYFAGYKMEGDNIKFSAVGTTMMAGPVEKMEAERKYFELLNSVDKVDVYKGKLVLTTKDGKKLIFKENVDNTNVPSSINNSESDVGPKSPMNTTVEVPMDADANE